MLPTPSLRGIFPQSRPLHKRDFLRENKLHLKDLQKNSTRQQLAQNIEADERKLAELRKEQGLRHRSLDGKSFPVAARTHRPARTGSTCSCSCGKIRNQNSIRSEMGVSRKVETSTREVQTDDILDEEFLYDALQRCSTSEIRLNGLNERIPHTNQRPVENQLHEMTRQRHVENQLHEPTRDNVCEPEPEPELDLDNLAIDTEGIQPSTSNTQLTKRSTNSNTQLLTKRSTARRVHELGDRQDLRLPKYLEKEKREKEELIRKRNQIDKNCPDGHEPLTDDERMKYLNLAERKFQNLIYELNHMPMTTETLRMRKRKVDIEKELVELENEIRIYSKPRVYMKTNPVL